MATRESKIRRSIRWDMLPYGVWTSADGRQVLFNRRYHPIWQRDTAGNVKVADADERVEWKTQNYFYNDGTPNMARLAIRAYETFTGEEWDWVDAKAEFRYADPRLRRLKCSAAMESKDGEGIPHPSLKHSCSH